MKVRRGVLFDEPNRGIGYEEGLMVERELVERKKMKKSRMIFWMGIVVGGGKMSRLGWRCLRMKR